MSNSIVKELHIDDEGLKPVKVIDINNLQKEGIKDVPAFLNGLLDAENDNEFIGSEQDYVKGYKYGKTGTF